ncbi:MAG: CRISPR-associated protein Cas4 [Bdellovibrionota bacterium]|jgi:CRISPR/Cas system-associated exonuclease Cas4 (RecB family)
MHDQIKNYLYDLLVDIANCDISVAIAVILLSCIVIVLDAISMAAKKKRQETGLPQQELKESLKPTGSDSLKPRSYVSDMQLLSGKPDALISENGYIIPIEHKPLGKKIRDRYVAQLLVHMRLVEEFEGKRPPYGYLIIGQNRRRVKIQNTPEKQAWLQGIIDEMQNILQKKSKAIATPQPQKCKKCPVRISCSVYSHKD